MPLTLLQIVNAAQGEIGLPVSTTVVGNPDQLTTQFLALLKRVGELVRKRANWTSLQSVWNIAPTPPINLLGNVVAGSTGVGQIVPNVVLSPSQANITDILPGWAIAGLGIDYAAQVATAPVTSPTVGVTLTMTEAASVTAEQVAIQCVQTNYPLPSDWDAEIADTGWDRGERWRLEGPLSPQDDEFYKSGLIQSAPWRKYRYSNGAIQFSPPVTGTPYGTVAIEYKSRAWVRSAAGALQTQFLADTDTTVFPDDIMVMGLKAQFKQAKGLDYTAEASDWSQQLMVCIARDNPQRTLSMSQSRVRVPPVQEGSFPGPTGGV